jgi:serine/threonine-protein kinase
MDGVFHLAAKPTRSPEHARTENLVRRDSKSDNMIGQPASRGAELNDVGAARMANASTIRPDTAPGTSPSVPTEQLPGKKVGAGSDPLADGVTRSRGTNGWLRFRWGNMTTSMRRIHGQAHRVLLEVWLDSPQCLKAIVDRALQKGANAPYSRSAETARDPRAFASIAVA